MNKNVRAVLDIVFYVVVFFLIQLLFTYIVHVAGQIAHGMRLQAALYSLLGGVSLSGKMMVTVSVLSSVFTLFLFIGRKWALVSKAWISTRPWIVLLWVGAAALGSILPSEWLVEQMEVNMPEAVEKMFEDIMSEPAGYMAIGILAPVAEEMVFRGAVLRRLLGLFSDKWHWVAIVVSAVIFGAVHGNVPQFVHAALIGLLLGWMYYRTGSVVAGIVFHWVNNTVAYVMFNLMPQMDDGKLIDLFHGNIRLMWMGLLCSCLIFLPALFQLSLRLKRSK